MITFELKFKEQLKSAEDKSYQKLYEFIRRQLSKIANNESVIQKENLSCNRIQESHTKLTQSSKDSKN